MANREFNIANAAETRLDASLAQADTTLTVASSANFPAAPFPVVLDADKDAKREVVFVSNVSGTTWTVTRGEDGSSPTPHDVGAVVAMTPVAVLWSDIHDRVEAHDHSGGTQGMAVATSDLTGHDKAAHDALNIDADTLDGMDSAAFAAVAGDTFTGAVTFEDGAHVGLADNAFALTDPATSYPAGVTTFRVTGGTWLASATIITVKHDAANGNVVQWMSTLNTPPVQRFRRWISGSLAWSDWQTLTAAEDPSTWEVDNSTEVASPSALTTSHQVMASVSLSIPSDWGSWKCEAYATGTFDGTSANSLLHKLTIDGVDQAEASLRYDNTDEKSVARGGHRTGMTTTGSRTISYQAKQTGGTFFPEDVFLYARAVRTS